jgi:hypothetical protein
LASIALCGWDGGTVNHRHLEGYMSCLEQLAAARVPGRQPWREWQEDSVAAQRAELGRRLFDVAEPEPCSPDDPDLGQAQAFLEVLGRGETEFLFVAVHEQDKRAIPKVFFGTLEQMLPALVRLQALGWGIFVTVNTTKGRRRRAVDVIEIRGLFTELDGAPLAPVLACKLPPHIVVESSPGRYHVYWLTEDLPLDCFRPVQDTIQARFGGDAKDIARVLRLPGFLHQKRSPFTVRIVQISDLGPYSPEQVMREFPPTWSAQERGAGAPGIIHDGGRVAPEHYWFSRLDPEQADIEVAKMLGLLTGPEFGDYKPWLRISMAIYRAGASLATWDDWCRQLPGYDQAENWRKWDSGTLAMDREYGITVGTLIHLVRQHGYQPPRDAIDHHAHRLARRFARANFRAGAAAVLRGCRA